MPGISKCSEKCRIQPHSLRSGAGEAESGLRTDGDLRSKTSHGRETGENREWHDAWCTDGDLRSKTSHGPTERLRTREIGENRGKNAWRKTPGQPHSLRSGAGEEEAGLRTTLIMPGISKCSAELECTILEWHNVSVQIETFGQNHSLVRT